MDNGDNDDDNNVDSDNDGDDKRMDIDNEEAEGERNSGDITTSQKEAQLPGQLVPSV